MLNENIKTSNFMAVFFNVFKKSEFNNNIYYYGYFFRLVANIRLNAIAFKFHMLM